MPNNRVIGNHRKVTIGLHPDLFEWLDENAKENYTSITDIIRRMIVDEKRRVDEDTDA